MRKVIFLWIVFLMIFCPLLGYAQNFKKQFVDIISTEDTAGQLRLLKKWEAAKPDDAELFIAYFNYYVKRSKIEVISIDSNQKGDSSLVLSDTGTGKTVGYINSNIEYNPVLLKRGFDRIDKGIRLYPQRLDMRFGEIYMLGEIGNYGEFTKQIISVIEYSHTIDNKWYWKEGKLLDSPEVFMLNSIQDYISTLYNSGDAQLPFMRDISLKVLEYYPNSVENLSNVAITYLISGEYDKALPYLLKAEKLAPMDIVVLNNIAETYHRKKDATNARIYYEKIIKVGNSEDIKDAKAKIQSLE